MLEQTSSFGASANGAVDYDFLRGMLLQERSQSNLELVEENFFGSCTGFMKTQENLLKDNFSLEQSRVLENSKKIVAEIKEVRLRKILFKAFRDLEANAVNSAGLAAEEKTFYRSLVSLLAQYRGKESVIEQTPAAVEITILADMPELQSPDGSAYGPFSAGQNVKLHPEIADLLLQKNLAKRK